VIGLWCTAVARSADTAAGKLPATQPAGSLRVMSFNIRYGTARDGENAWDRRREFVAHTIKTYQPDLLGMQEVLAEQGDYLRQALPDYAYVGGGRDDGKRAGEASPIMYRKARFQPLADGQFWLSDTPEKIASRGWDAALPRVATWVRLKDRQTGKTVFFITRTGITSARPRGLKARR
jgi:endonuclease/exonuclease/phosphatase family metal-dependent hydrolase